MARQPKPVEDFDPPAEPITETVTYIPGPMDPPVNRWCGHTFHANVPKELTGHPEGTERQRLNHWMIENARGNKSYRVGNSSVRSTSRGEPPKTSDQYKAYFVNWLQDRSIEHAEDLIERFARDRELQATCEVGTDDYSYMGSLFMPRLAELARGDELTEQQVAAIWIRHGFNVLPW